ncbi:MAG: SRPBCC family protein [Pseudomonadota bacterium]
MAAHSFHLTTSWRIEAGLDQVCHVLTDAQRLPSWWGDVYLEVRQISEGDDRGVGSVVEVLTKGALPYTLRWQATLLTEDFPRRWEIGASGDLSGRGVWNLRPDGSVVHAHYDWRVDAEKPVLRVLSPLLKPLFAWNHNWAMAKGRAGIDVELNRLFGKDLAD